MANIHIPFNRVDVQGNELEYIKEVIANAHISGDGLFTQKCNSLLEKELDVNKSLLTTSCTHALEISAILLDIKPGDEVIVPSFTFVSTIKLTFRHMGTLGLLHFPQRLQFSFSDRINLKLLTSEITTHATRAELHIEQWINTKIIYWEYKKY